MKEREEKKTSSVEGWREKNEMSDQKGRGHNAFEKKTRKESLKQSRKRGILWGLDKGLHFPIFHSQGLSMWITQFPSIMSLPNGVSKRKRKLLIDFSLNLYPDQRVTWTIESTIHF